MRKLASVRRVHTLLPIEGADVLECAKIDGWQCVVKRGQFKEGDLGVFLEIDSFVPVDKSQFSFLRPRVIEVDGVKGCRIKSCRLRQCLSQGLFIPLLDFPELVDVKENDDVTEILGITKWEPPIPANLAGEVFGMLPGFLKKTDQERIQNLWKEVNRDILHEVSIKLDGTSCQMAWYMDNFMVCSRNLNLKPNENNTLWQMAYKYDMLEKLTKLNRKVSFQGEVIGEGICKNNEKIKGQDFYVFDIWDIDTQSFVGTQERQDLVAYLGLKSVPILETRKFDFKTIEQAMEYAHGPSLNPDVKREGVVWKAIDGSLSFKIVDNNYLLKHGDR